MKKGDQLRDAERLQWYPVWFDIWVWESGSRCVEGWWWVWSVYEGWLQHEGPSKLVFFCEYPFYQVYLGFISRLKTGRKWRMLS